MFYTTTIIRCDECGYEEPNDYYFGSRDWYFCENEKNEVFHFCSEDCKRSCVLYSNERIINTKILKNSEVKKHIEEFKKKKDNDWDIPEIKVEYGYID